MALKHKLDTLEGLDEALKPLYAKSEDGRFTLQVDDAPATNTITKLKADLEAATTALKVRDKAEEDHKRKADEDLALKRGEFDKVRAQDLADLEKERTRASELEAKLLNGTRDRALMEVMQDPSIKGIPKALLPHIQGLVEVVPDGDGFKVVPKGNPAQKLTEFVSSFKKDMPWGFEGSGANGGGAQNPGKPGPTGQPTTTHEKIVAGLREAGLGN